MSDYISRQAAITLPVMPKEHREYQTYNFDDAYEEGWFDLQKCIEGLPSADVRENGRGKWVWNQYGKPNIGNYHCSVCRNIAIEKYDFCPNCGAKMEGE